MCPERVEKFSCNYIWRKLTNDITIDFIEAAVDRMLTADEVTGWLISENFGVSSMR